MERSRYLSGMLGAEVFLKCENLQRTGAYKIRGAYNMLSKLSPEQRERGVVAASAGNHAQGVAFAATELGMRSTIFMPLGVALPKLQATRDYGAAVVLSGHLVEDALRAAKEFADTTGAVFIPPYDHADVIAGQGTLGLEILDQVPDVDTIVMAIGGGGLIAGVASVVTQVRAKQGRSIRIIGERRRNQPTGPRNISRLIRTRAEAPHVIPVAQNSSLLRCIDVQGPAGCYSIAKAVPMQIGKNPCSGRMKVDHPHPTRPTTLQLLFDNKCTEH